jgi:hypothetical protein
MKGLSQQEQKDIVRWMFAEAYAVGARFHVPYPSLDYYAPLDECRRYVQFIQDNREAYEGADHLADVGVLFSYASEIWDYWAQAGSGEPNHSRQWYGLSQALTDMSVQYDVVFAADGDVIESDLTLNDLVRHETLLVPWAYSLRDEDVHLLEQYAQSGGRLVIVGDFATFDEARTRRSPDVLASSQGLGAAVVVDLDFEAYLNNPGGRNAAAVLRELESLIPNRLVTTANDSVTAQLSRVGNTLYCHLINRDRRGSGFTPKVDFKVRITVPPDLGISEANAVYMSPDLSDGQPIPLPMTGQDGAVEITVPSLEIYGVLVIPMIRRG